MSNSPAPASRVADYFFVAGLHDSHLIPTYQSAKKYQRTGDNDVLYYQQQEQAVSGSAAMSESPPPLDTMESNIRPVVGSRRRGYTVAEPPMLRSTLSEAATSASLLGVLDHVQNVIDNFDKERDTARDNVIAVQGPYTEKYKRSDSDKTITLNSNHRSSIYSIDEATRRMSVRDAHASTSTRKWRSPSDPKKRKCVCACEAFLGFLKKSNRSGQDKAVLCHVCAKVDIDGKRASDSLGARGRAQSI